MPLLITSTANSSSPKAQVTTDEELKKGGDVDGGDQLLVAGNGLSKWR